MLITLIVPAADASLIRELFLAYDKNEDILRAKVYVERQIIRQMRIMNIFISRKLLNFTKK